MASKWKYATIPAEQRLNMLKEGNDALYKEELARTQDVIASRLEVGLDVKEQMDWADKISYNYELGKAERSGSPTDNISRTGYADQLFGNFSVSTKNGTSTTSNPQNVKNPYGKTETSYEKAYQRGVNERAQILNNEYATYVQNTTAEFEKKKKQLIKEHERLEKLYAEQSLNDGYSQYGGRSLTEKLRARETLVDALAALDSEKNALILNAQNSLRSQLNDVTSAVAKTISDEYYRHASLNAEKDALEYKRLRDAIDDDFRWQEFLYSKERDAAQDSFTQQDYLLALKKLEQQKYESDMDYETRMKELEADNAYRYRKLDDDKEIAYAKIPKSSSDTQEQDILGEDYKKFGETYINYANRARYYATMVENTGDGYRKKYSDSEIVDWIKTFPLTEEEKKKICKDLGLKYN